MNSKYLKYLPIFIIFILGGISITWTNSHSLLNTGDFLFPADRMRELKAFFYSWNNVSLGYINYFQLDYVLPYGLLLILTQLIGISVIYSQIFWNYLLFTSLGLSMYFLVISIMKQERNFVAALLAAVFFMFNPWVALNVAMFFPYITFIPLLLGLYIMGLDEDRGIKYQILFSLIWYFVLSLSLWNIRGYIFQLLLLALCLLFFFIQCRKKIRHSLIFTLVLMVFYILLNAHWLFIFLTNFLKSVSGSINVYEAVNYSRFSSFEIASTTLIQSFRLLADWAMTANIKGVLHFPWVDYYQQPLLIFIGFLLPFSTLVSLLYVMKRKLDQNKHFVFFFILLLFGYFISMGKFNPTGMWLADKLKYYLLIFSAPAVHGGIFIVISYSVLLAYSFVFICNIIKDARIRSIIAILYMLAIMIYGYPVWSGKFIPLGNKMLGAGRYEIPSYVSNMALNINKDKLNYRILPLPYSKLGYFAYNWPPGGYNGPDPLTNMLPKPQVIGTGLGMQIADETSRGMDVTTFFRLNSLLNVKYVMNKKDANLLHIKNNSWYVVPDQIFLNSLYQNQENVNTFGQIDLIKIPDELFLPKLYTPLKVINANNVNELPNIVSQKDYVTRSAIYVGNNPNTPNIPNIPNKTILEYRMISPVTYRVKVHNAEGSFPLVMSEGFHEGWKMYLSSSTNYQIPTINYKLENFQGTIQNDDLPAGPIYETWLKKPIVEEKNHLMVNSYANSWIVDTNKICNFSLDSRLRGNDGLKCIKNADGGYDFEVVIEFWPQRIYYFGLAISLTTLLSCIGYLIAQYVISKKSSDSEDD